MEKFTLKTNDGEKIATAHASDIVEARDIFAQMKRLPVLKLLQIFKVEKVA